MAARGVPHPQKVRDRIAATMIVTRLVDHVAGRIEMTQTQVAAAKILLAKVVPDLKQHEHTGEIVNRIIAIKREYESPADPQDR